MTDQNHVIGLNLSKLRERHELTQERFAGYLGISRVTLTQYETGARNIPTGIIEAAAAFFGIDDFDLYEEGAAMTVNTAFAFRADALNEEDLKEIAGFRKIVKNFLQMQRAQQHHEGSAA